jgi:hypothetical protein
MIETRQEHCVADGTEREQGRLNAVIRGYALSAHCWSIAATSENRNAVLDFGIVYVTIVAVKPIRFSRSARRQKIGKAHAYHVMSSSEPTIVTEPQTNQSTLSWIANDSRKRELEIVAVETPDCFLVIHVMPTSLRKKGRKR